MKRLVHRDGDCLPLPGSVEGPEQVHCFTQPEIDAVHGALAARRPLLVRGEPGVGKSQLAKAVAMDLRRAYVQQVIDIRTESRDLLWHFDAVGRLADAQLRGALAGQGRAAALQTTQAASKALKEALAVERYLHPRALWWGFDWYGAAERARSLRRPIPEVFPGCDPTNGVVVLIDEIDKADSDVPNGLLEALGAGCFTPQGMSDPVIIRGPAPLVIITTNEERALPDAFLRRCLVLQLELPAEDDALSDRLVARAQAHFRAQRPDPDVLREAVRQLIEDRRAALKHQWRPVPGQAEYLDLVRAVLSLAETSADQLKLLEQIRPYLLQKHRDTPA
jgi:MoxR-like ATPase